MGLIILIGSWDMGGGRGERERVVLFTTESTRAKYTYCVEILWVPLFLTSLLPSLSPDQYFSFLASYFLFLEYPV